MIKIHRRYEFAHNLDTVLKVCFYDLWEKENPFEDMPNVKSCKVEKKEEKNGKTYLTIRYSAYGQIPRMIQHLIKPEMLSWRENAVWDPEKLVYSYQIVPFYFSRIFNCRGTWSYQARGENRTVQTCGGFIDIRLPVFGPFVEKEIIKNLYVSLDESYKEGMEKMNELKK